MKEYDVAIIGAGTAGLSARREVEKITKNYVVIDDGVLGTTCARVGCMPSKVLIQVANDFHRRHQLEEMGIKLEGKITVDHSRVMNHVRELRDRFVRGVMNSMDEWTENHLIRKRARFIDQNTLDLGDEKIKAKSIIIGTGSKPILPEEWKPYSKYLFTTDDFFEMKVLPRKVGVIGLGVIGLELGQALSRLGIEVVGFSSKKALGGLSDPELQEYTASKFEQEFPIHYGRSSVVGEKDGEILIQSGEEVVAVEKVFLTMGRSPRISDLDLNSIGVVVDEKGLPEIDKNTFQIPGTRLFVAGDSTGDRAILHEAADEGRIAGYNAVRAESECFRRRETLTFTFSDPNIAIVGKSYQELRNQGLSFVTGKVSYEGQGRAIVKLKEKGALHVYGDKQSGKILGAELFAPDGEHLAHLLAWVMNLNLSVFDVLSLPFYHPVVEEGLRTAIRSLARQVEKEAPPLEVLRCEDPPAGNCG